MSNTAIAPVSFSYETAALATGYSEDVIRRAVRAGDIEIRYPVVDGRPLFKGTIPAASLDAWVLAGKTERVAS